jgi:hydroxymethylpyrimidine pyrophosphatase-like HAD family hydrolase
MPYQPFRLDRLNVLAEYSKQAPHIGSHPNYPALSLCSGRAYPYVEAMSQLLRIQTPVLFESGAGMFDPVSAVSTWHPDFTRDIRMEVDDIRSFLENVVADNIGLSIDYAKRSQAALVGSPNGGIEEARLEVDEYVTKNHPSFNVFHTHISIDVVPPGLTKAEGMQWLAQTCGISVSEMAFVGDTGGDVGALLIVGASFAPANGTQEAKSSAKHASSFNDIEAVLEAYEMSKVLP